MTNFQIIEHKLHRFIRKYYVNELIRGVILFLATGLLYFITVAAVEYFLWLSKLGRTILFWSFVAVELGLLYKFIVVPIARLIKLFNGIDFSDASKMIGLHFPEVSDKLINVLQLQASGGDDDLTWASINQKSEELKPIPFSLAIDFRKNRQYLKYLAIPVVIFAVLLGTGNNEVISSASRVVDYNTEYKPPAPFTFLIDNDNLNALENEPFTLRVKIQGSKLPESASIIIDDNTFYLNQIDLQSYTYTFDRPSANTSFVLQANSVTSLPYELHVAPVPTINSFELQMDYPAYTGKKDEILKATGNAIVPQGTRITWLVNASATQLVQFKTVDKNQNFEQQGDGEFAFAKAVTQNMPYSITTSNQNVLNYEQLDFNIDVVVDEYPELLVEMKRDSIDDQIMYFKGQAADDYGLKSVQLVYYNTNDLTDLKKVVIPNAGGTFEQFVQVIPGGLELEPGNSYEFYFMVTDNDAVNNYKVTRSQVFAYNKPSLQQQEELQLQDQKESLNQLEQSIKEQDREQETLKELSKEQIEKDARSFNDKRKLDQAVKNQQRQEQEIRKELDRLEKQLDKTGVQDDPKKAQLQERLKETAQQSKENEELLKKIEEYQDKISKEELQEELEKSRKNTKQQQRSLKQLLELTKRYYVAQKFEQLGRKLEELANQQEEQSNKPDSQNKALDQEQLNEKYLQWEQELRELEKENNALKEAMDLEFDPQQADEIKDNQQQATKSLKENDSNQAQPKQKKAADKMKEQAASMAQDMAAMEGEQMEEDLDMLRQILDNLIVFSQSQEKVLEQVKALNSSSSRLGKNLRQQKELELAFKHVDDSLFALSARNADLGKSINEEVVDVYYFLERSLEQLAEFDLNQGQVSQQLALGSANELAVLLTQVLDAANNPSMPGKPSKSGQGAGFQLPDVIKKQESLSKGEGEQDGQEGKNGESGKKPGEGSPGQSGKAGKQGAQGEQGASGNQGQQGNAGQQGLSGQQGSNGQQGTGDGEGDDKGRGMNGNTGERNGNGSGNGTGNGSVQGRDGEGSYRESEEESERIYEIYKQQQELRNQLENMIINEGLQQKVDDITGAMKGVERKLLDQGYNREVQEQMSEIIYDLLKLKDANQQQGEEEQRRSQTNLKQFSNPLKVDPELIQRYFNNTEILNRQVLPLQPQYRNKVKEYFKSND